MGGDLVVQLTILRAALGPAPDPEVVRAIADTLMLCGAFEASNAVWRWK